MWCVLIPGRRMQTFHTLMYEDPHWQVYCTAVHAWHKWTGLDAKTQDGENMLILTRRPGEAIRIGDEVEIYVVAVNGNQVRLGIKAPKSVPVHRQEIYERISAQSADDKSGADDPSLPSPKVDINRR